MTAGWLNGWVTSFAARGNSLTPLGRTCASMNLEAVVRTQDGIVPEPEAVVDSPDQLSLLAHPVRQAILHHLTQRELTTGDLAEAVGIERNRLYHHLERLVEAGMVAVSREDQVGHMTVRRYRAVAERFVVDLVLPREEP